MCVIAESNRAICFQVSSARALRYAGPRGPATTAAEAAARDAPRTGRGWAASLREERRYALRRRGEERHAYTGRRRRRRRTSTAVVVTVVVIFHTVTMATAAARRKVERPRQQSLERATRHYIVYHLVITNIYTHACERVREQYV